MHRSLTCLLPVLALLAAGGLLFAGDEEPAPVEQPDRVLKPFLWEIPGEVPSYLFGTAHTVDERVTKMHPVARKAFEEAQAVYLEVDLVKDAPKQLAAMRLPEGKKTEDMIPADLLERLDARLAKISPLLNRAQVGHLKTFAWVVLVPTLYEQLKKPGVPVLDAKLYGEAMRAGKIVGGLEDPAEQTAFVDSVTNDEALLMLRVMLDQWDEDDAQGTDPTAELIGHYLQGDGKGLSEYAMRKMRGEEIPKELTERLMKGLAYDRNERIAKAIAKHVAEHPKRRYFFAVGAMHLIDKQCVQDYLEKLGVKTRRVEVPADEPAAKKPEPAGAGGG